MSRACGRIAGRSRACRGKIAGMSREDRGQIAGRSRACRGKIAGMSREDRGQVAGRSRASREDRGHVAGRSRASRACGLSRPMAREKWLPMFRHVVPLSVAGCAHARDLFERGRVGQRLNHSLPDRGRRGGCPPRRRWRHNLGPAAVGVVDLELVGWRSAQIDVTRVALARGRSLSSRRRVRLPGRRCGNNRRGGPPSGSAALRRAPRPDRPDRSAQWRHARNPRRGCSR